MKKRYGEKQGFTIIVAIFMIGFLLVLTTGVFNLILREMKDNRGAENYLKAYAGAEGAMELSLLKIKHNGYGFDHDLIAANDPGRDVLNFDGSFNIVKDARIQYDMDIAVDSHSGSIGTGSTVIIPLFSKNIGGTLASASNLSITLSGNDSDLLWNVIGKSEGLSGIGSNIFNNNAITYRDSGGNIITEKVQAFLQKANNKQSYLMLFNKNVTNSLEYILRSNDGTNFSRPEGIITSSATAGKYRQNISTSIDNSEFLKMLKYSIYSN